MIATIIFLIIGFALLVKGADLLVDGASAVAKRYGISDIVIGLTIVAFGTSAPELIVNIMAAVRGTADIAIGNILGSNIANILLILGISAVIYPLSVKKNTVWKEIPLAFLAVLAVGFMANDRLIDGGILSALTRIDGLILIAFFVIFMYYTFGIARATGEGEEAEMDIKRMGGGKASLLIGLGLAALVLGGQWVVDSAIEFASALGLSASFIGLTVVAVGTSLPELATSAVAAWKKKSDIAIGNVVGSNIFNIFWILGVSAIIRPLPFAPGRNFDIAAALLASFLLFAFMFIGRRHQLERWQGVLFLALYAGYVAWLAVLG